MQKLQYVSHQFNCTAELPQSFQKKKNIQGILKNYS